MTAVPGCANGCPALDGTPYSIPDWLYVDQAAR
jgi:hypothetical protein